MPATTTNDAAFDKLATNRRSTPCQRRHWLPDNVAARRPQCEHPGHHEEVRNASAWVTPLRQQIGRVIVGQHHLVDRLLIGLITTAIFSSKACRDWQRPLRSKTLAAATQVKFQRLQFTPDMLPADIVGTLIYQSARRFVQHQARPDFRQPHSRRRNQPRARQGAECAA